MTQPQPPQPNVDAMLGMMETFAPVASMMTGLRQQLLDQGWPLEQAGQVVILTFQMALAGNNGGSTGDVPSE